MITQDRCQSWSTGCTLTDGRPTFASLKVIEYLQGVDPPFAKEAMDAYSVLEPYRKQVVLGGGAAGSRPSTAASSAERRDA